MQTITTAHVVEARLKGERLFPGADKIPFMEANGFTCHLSITVNFVKGSLHVWRNRNNWTTAWMTDGKFQTHQTFNTLEEVVKYHCE